MARLDQQETAVKLTKDRPTRRHDRAPDVDMHHKLQEIVVEIKECGHANRTRLTVLKKWFEPAHRLRSFGIFIANQASRRTHQATAEAVGLFREAHEILAGVNVFEPNISRTHATRVYARLQAFQNEHQNQKWTTVRVIQNQSLFFVEGGLGLYLRRGDSPTDGYRLAAAYCEHYDPRYGTGFSGPSAARIKEIADFVLAAETYEQAGSKLPFLQS
jgi:hypothetical protein